MDFCLPRYNNYSLLFHSAEKLIQKVNLDDKTGTAKVKSKLRRKQNKKMRCGKMRGKKNERESDKDSWKKTKSERSVQKVKTK